MRKRTVKCLKKAWMFMLLAVLTLGFIAFPMQAEASWINRDQTGIYYEDSGGGLGQGIGELDEDENAEEVEVDEGSGFFLELINTILCWLLSTVGRTLFELLDLVGASLDHLIYGRLVTENTLFTFDLGKDNIYGIVGFAIYGILSTCTIAMLIPIFTGKVVISAWKKGDFAKSSLKDAFSYFVLSLLLVVLMPFFLDVMLFLRDVILYVVGTDGATSLFGSESATSIISVLGAAANDNIISGVVFVAAVVLNLYFLIGYVGIALSMTANFILFPMVVLKMAFDRQVLKDWIWEMVSCMFVPIIDAVLIMIPSFLGVYASELSALDSIGISVVQLIICYLIIPIRTYSRRILGLSVNPLENSGLAAASFMGIAAARGIKNAFSDSRDSKKNAELDRERADAEEDLAQLEKEEQENAFAGRAQTAEADMPSSEDIRKMIDRKMGVDELSKEDGEEDSLNPLGMQQTYADGLDAHIKASEDFEGPLPKEAYLSEEEKQNNAKRLEELDQELNDARDKKNALENERAKILNDDNLSTAEKAESVGELDKAIEGENERIQELQKKREAVMSVDDKIREAHKRKAQLENEYHQTAEEAGMDAVQKEERLEHINDQIKSVDEEIVGLQKQKERMQIEKEKEALLKEPATLREEYANLKASNEKLNLDREELIRQRERLVAKQGNYVVGSAEHERFGEEIGTLNQRIGKLDTDIANNVASQNTVSRALAKQESGLYDRQAYNLHERVKAQDAYESARGRAAEIEKQLKNAEESGVAYLAKGTMQRRKLESELKGAKEEMSRAKERLGALSVEDRKIAERLKEISPDINQLTEKDLRAAKQEKMVQRAGIQKEIAAISEQMEADRDPVNRPFYRSQIAKLQSEVADCNYQSAKIDQMLSGMGTKSGRSRTGGTSKTQTMDVGTEYEKKRVAIMERYANVDNFEQPEFSGISREKKAQLYRERAMRTQKVFTRKRVAGVAGAVIGGSAGLWLGSAGVASGSIIGHAVGAELGVESALRYASRERSTRPIDYHGQKIDFHVSSDLRDNTPSGQRRTVERVRAELVNSLQTDKFQSAVEEELSSNNLLKNEIKTLFKKHSVTKDNYSSKREAMLKELQVATIQTVENAEAKIVERCAGEEYAKLSEHVKKKIVKSVAKPNMDVFQDLCESQYLCANWQPHYEEYFDE